MRIILYYLNYFGRIGVEGREQRLQGGRPEEEEVHQTESAHKAEF